MLTWRLPALLGVVFFATAQLLAQAATAEPAATTSTPPEKRVEAETRKNKPAIELVRADEAEYLTIKESKEGVMIFRGGIIIRMGEKILKADVVKLNPATGEVYGEGGVTFEDGLQKISGDRFIYDNKHGQGVIYKADTYLKPIYYMGEEMRQVSERAFLVKVAFFTTCNAKNPHYFFKARRVYVYENNQVVALHATYHVGGVPVFYWPILTDTDIGTGVIFQYGVNRTRGHFGQATYYFGVPGDQSQFFVPTRSKVMLDVYQKLGQFFGTRLIKDSRNLSYDVDVGIARYKQREEVTINNESKVTTQVLKDDGTYGTVYETWWKAKSDIRALWDASHQYDSQSSLYVRFEDYKHQDFEREFGQRFEPPTTPQAFGAGLTFAGDAGKNDLLWQAVYNEDWGDNHLGVEVSRRFAWLPATDPSNSDYVPTYDLAPKINFGKRMQLIKPIGTRFAGGWNNIQLNGSVNRYYTQGSVLKTIFAGDGLSQFSLYFPLYRWLTFTPSLGYGFIHQFARESDTALAQETARASYQFVFTQDSLRIGYPFLHSRLGYNLRYGFDEGATDPTFQSQREHSADVALVSDLYPIAHFSVDSKRDLRRYPYAIEEKQRWAPLTARGRIDYDFVHGFSSSYFGLARRRHHHFLGVGADNAYVYLIRYDKSATNDLSLYFQAGGYRPIIFRELVDLKVGATWHHDYIDVRQGAILFSWHVEMLLTKFWRLNTGANSRAAELERYQPGGANHVNFFDDLRKGLNPFEDKEAGDTVFNIENFYVNLERNLHRWVLRLSYTMAKRTYFFGEGRRDRKSFFEQTFYVSMYLKDFTGFGIPRTQVYRNNPSDDLL